MVCGGFGGLSWLMGDCKGDVTVGEESNVRFGITMTDDLAGLYPQSEKEIKFDIITRDMLDIYCRKNHDYGDSFGEGFKEFGLISSVVRLGDKYRRLKTLAKDDARVKDESIKDTLMDMACYCVMTLVELEEDEDTDEDTGM